MSSVQLDTKGLKCPLPVLRARKAMKPMAAGEILEVEATDPSSVQDFKAFCETTGDELLESREADGVYSFRIRKTG
ncbi:sulfurtransferase TusA family protein [Denitrobaculum tricleocarpae]|uniref:Sulfurtransferase TusA family protein n=1 Tax=Denitrobaculum tricleocarpae TaxID=2591009 RepID=A0A545TXL8_9PROT|nr:sulfurtransferase TusA family protein [Denitrobaculum tricleocarpae]TQV81976.1 sulfurtransferase TusA family protein [Denitrobaculum tricleocarpae]